MVYFDEQTIRQLYDAFRQRDLGVIIRLYAEDVVMYVPGRSRISGEYRGRQAVMEFWTRQFDLAGDSFKPRVLNVVESGDHVVLITELSVERNEQTLSWRRAIDFKVYDSRIVEAWFYEHNQLLADEVFA